MAPNLRLGYLRKALAQFAHQQFAATEMLWIFALRQHDHLIGKILHLAIRLKNVPNAPSRVCRDNGRGVAAQQSCPRDFKVIPLPFQNVQGLSIQSSSLPASP
jgi:hypothetical protein